MSNKYKKQYSNKANGINKFKRKLDIFIAKEQQYTENGFEYRSKADEADLLYESTSMEQLAIFYPVFSYVSPLEEPVF